MWSGTADSGRYRHALSADLKVGTTYCDQRPGAPVKQQWRRRDSDSGQNTRAGHLREDQTWSERHDSEQQMPATCFAAPPILFAEPVLPDDDAVPPVQSPSRTLH